MGTQCVRLSPKLSSHPSLKGDMRSSRIRVSDQILHFELIISNLQLQCSANNVGKVVFSVENYLNLEFACQDFFSLDKMIKCSSSKKASFSVHAKNIEFLQFKVSILDTKGNKIEKVCLKMHSVCQGPRLHDHLLKQMKARIIYNLEISQLVTAAFGCSDYKIYDLRKNDVSQDYGLSLDIIIPGKDWTDTDEKRILFSKNPQEDQKYFKNNIPSKKLKQSLVRIMLYKISSMGYYPNTDLQPQLQICIPYMKFWSQDDISVVSQKNGDRIFQKTNLKYQQRIKDTTDSFIDVYLNLNIKTTKVYLQQIQCLIYSENGLNTVSPYLLTSHSNSVLINSITPRDLQVYQTLFKKQRKVTYQTKNQIQKIIKDCYNNLFDSQKTKVCNPSDLQIVQMSMLNILNSLCQLITQGEDVTNQSIWKLIDKIIHRPQLSVNYLYLIQNPSQKIQIGLKFYGFIFGVLSKIIICTTMSMTMHQLKCIQKFIGYVYFRCHWIQDLVIKSLKRQDDPEFSQQKLMEIGVYLSNRSPSKSMVYDWEQCLLPYVRNDIRYRQISNNLLQTSQSVPKWSELLFSRDDDDLYYGLIIQIWNEAELFLNNHGRIMWEYFPNYAQLLGTFLGQMNRNKIMDYSSLFSECSMKLISNQKLLNNFVMFLFPKTCLYQTYCVIKCLELIQSYFQAISKQNKRMPNQFNFNYFYTGIRCIFESNHSYLLIRVIGVLYDYYHIFSNQFKNSLDKFIFSKSFNYIFLHWCGYVRKMFYLFLQHKINAKFKEHDQNKMSPTKTSLSFEGIQKMNHFHQLIQNLERQQKKYIKQKQINPYKEKKEYFMNMKQKLNQRKFEKKSVKHRQQINTATSLDFQEQFHFVRKNTLCINSEKQLPRTPRKWSLKSQEDQDIKTVPAQLLKYIEISMKQYRQIRASKRPDQQVQKIMKIFHNGSKSIDS